MPATNIKLSHIEDTTTNITAGKRRNMFAFDTTKDVAIYYKNDGSTIRNFVMADSSNNVIQTINNVTVGGVLTGSGTINLSGTVNANAIYHLAGSDTDTNITFADDDILLTAGGVEFLQATEAAQDVLRVNPDSSDIDFIINANGAEALRVDGASGDTTINGQNLYVDNGAAYLRYATSKSNLWMETYSATDSDNSTIRLNKSSSGTLGALAQTVADESLGSIYFGGVNAAGTPAIAYAATIEVVQADAAGTDYIGGELLFKTGTSTSAPAQRMRISNGGLVSIGSVSPDCNLHVHKATAGTVAAPTYSVIAAENSDNCMVSLLSPNNKYSGLFFGDPDDNDIGRLLYDHSTDAMKFYTTNTLRLTLDATNGTFVGNVVTSKGQYHYIGDPAAQYSWRFTSAAGASDLIVEYAATAGVWTEKFRVTI